MKRWFKASIILIVLATVVFFVDLMYAIQIDAYFGYGKIPFFGYYPSVSLFILLLVVIMFALSYFAFLMGAKPVLDRELFGKRAFFWVIPYHLKVMTLLNGRISRSALI